MKIGKDFSFEAAHRLQHHDGKCRNLHGHSYRVFVEIYGPDGTGALGTEGSSEGMMFDFGLLSQWWKGIEPSLDHTTILQDNDPLVEALAGLGREGTSTMTFPWPPTAEHLAIWIRDDLRLWLGVLFDTGQLSRSYSPRVRVYETAKSWAEV